ncbi:ABC transporter ATP-binding protein, partial [Leptolyngbya cf. ectocarpi LEGE 11479]
MADDTAISLTNVSKVFKQYHRPVDRLKELLLPGKQKATEFWALQDINLEIPKGETVGIIGRNGSGKSTLLQIIAGTLRPTTGNLQVNGRVSALLELGSGFNPEFTGRQNVFFNGRILGLSQEEIQNRFEEIEAFADIGKFIDQPVKTYSSGMFVRLAFAVAINVEPDILIVDEALAVGDEIFQRKCFAQINRLQSNGVTVLFVSHSSSLVVNLCKSALWLDYGKTLFKGDAKIVVDQYQRMINNASTGKSVDSDNIQAELKKLAHTREKQDAGQK